MKCTLKDFKDANMKIIIFCILYFFSLLQQIKTDGNDTLLLSEPNYGVFKDTGHNQLRITGLLCFARPYKLMKRNILSFHMLLVSIHVEKHSKYSFIA